MTLQAAIISEGTCPDHGIFRRVAAEFEETSRCPGCDPRISWRHPMKQVGTVQTSRSLPYTEATEERFKFYNHTIGVATAGSHDYHAKRPGRKASA